MRFRKFIILLIVIVGMAFAISNCQPPKEDEEVVATESGTGTGGDTGGTTGGSTGGTTGGSTGGSSGGSTGGSSGGSTGGSSGGSSGGSGGDTTAPTISSYTPSNNAGNIAVNSNMTVTFNESMKSSTINNTNITLTNSGSNVAIAVSLSGNTATINPNADLNNGTTYTWTVGTGVQDTAGNALSKSISYTFTTVASSGGGGGGGGGNVAAHLTPQSRFSAGYDAMAYILDNGSVIQWGYFTDESAARSQKIVDNLTNARQVAIHGTTSTGGVHACVIKTDNTSVCWGENSASQLADNTTNDCGVGENTTTPKRKKTACAVPIFDDNTAQGNLKKVAAGWKTTLWLDNNGKVYSAGECSNGRLGNGCTDNNTRTATTVMTGVKDIDMMNSIACAHKTDNSLWCWGGQNGYNYITSDNTSDIQTPIQVATNVEHFDVGNTFIAMVKSDNSISCTANWKHSSALCANKFSSYTAVKGMYASSLAGLLLDNGSQVSYGYDYNGTLATKTGNSPQNNYTVQHGWIYENGALSQTDNITYIEEGNSTVFGIMDNGSVVGVGANNNGQMGGAADNVTCYWNGSASTPCTDGSQVNDVFIYLGLDPSGPAR